MKSALSAMGGWLRQRAENLAAAMLAVMFGAFILQIVFRYLFNFPVGWTHEVSVIMWLWLVLFGSAFVVRESEEIRFDIICSAVGAGPRRAMAFATAAALVCLFSLSLPAVIDYVAFMRVQKTAYLKIRFDYLYAMYVVFAVAMILRYLWLGWQAIWGGGPAAYDPTKASSGV